MSAPQAPATAIEPVKDVPGGYGPPLIGGLVQTIQFLFRPGWQEFFLSRKKKHGSSVFRVSALGRAIALVDPVAFDPLFNWDGRLSKEYGFGWARPPKALVGHITPSVFETGEAHDAPKRFYMELLKANAASMPQVFDEVASFFFARWVKLGAFSWRDEIEDLCATFAFRWFLGESLDPADVRQVYIHLFDHRFISLTNTGLDRSTPGPRSRSSAYSTASSVLVAFPRSFVLPPPRASPNPISSRSNCCS